MAAALIMLSGRLDEFLPHDTVKRGYAHHQHCTCVAARGMCTSRGYINADNHQTVIQNYSQPSRMHMSVTGS